MILLKWVNSNGKVFINEILYLLMNVIFEVIDKGGRGIRLTDKQWKHVSRKHPLMTKYSEEIKETLIRPDSIVESNYDEDVRFYYKYYKNLKSPYNYLMTIVKYLNGIGFIISAYFEKYIK